MIRRVLSVSDGQILRNLTFLDGQVVHSKILGLPVDNPRQAVRVTNR